MTFYFLFLAWLVSLVATLGSLFFSEVMSFIPCSMCWYQRIAMYPLTLILAFGLFPLDIRVFRYAAPLAVVGWFFALYHNFLHWGVIPETVAPCRMGVPCSTVYVNYLGFLTIPLMSLISFSIILVLLFLFRREFKKGSF